MEFALFSVDFPMESEDLLASGQYLERRRYRNVALGCEIPHSLLLGPWTEEMLRHLYWFIQGLAAVATIHSTGAEVGPPQQLLFVIG